MIQKMHPIQSATGRSRIHGSDPGQAGGGRRAMGSGRSRLRKLPSGMAKQGQGAHPLAAAGTYQHNRDHRCIIVGQLQLLAY